MRLERFLDDLRGVGGTWRLSPGSRLFVRYDAYGALMETGWIRDRMRIRGVVVRRVDYGPGEQDHYVCGTPHSPGSAVAYDHGLDVQLGQFDASTGRRLGLWGHQVDAIIASTEDWRHHPAFDGGLRAGILEAVGLKNAIRS